MRNHETEIEPDRVAESLARRTRAEWIVETKESRFGSRVDSVVILAFETFGEPESFRLRFGGFDERGAVSFLKADFERVDEALAHVRARDQTIDEHVDVFKIVAHVVVRRF